VETLVVVFVAFLVFLFGEHLGEQKQKDHFDKLRADLDTRWRAEVSRLTYEGSHLQRDKNRLDWLQERVTEGHPCQFSAIDPRGVRLRIGGKSGVAAVTVRASIDILIHRET